MSCSTNTCRAPSGSCSSAASKSSDSSAERARPAMPSSRSSESSYRPRSVPSVVRRARMTFTARRCSHVPNAASERNVESLLHARTNTSCVRSSACSSSVMRRARLWTRATCVRYNRSNARPSPEAASATSAVSASRAVWSRSLRSVATPGVVSSMCLIRYGLGVKGCSGSGRLRAVTTDLPALAGLGLVLGLRHAFEPDHLAAVSTLATRQGRLLDACRLGLAWALGHTASVGVVVGAIILFGWHLPDRLWPAADLLVGLLLVGLGGTVILRYARGRWHLHLHSHNAESAPHLHLHSHAQGAEHSHSHPQADARRSLGFGLLHGLAGSAAILVLLVAAAPTRTAQLAYFVAFAAGTVIGMLLVSVSLASAVRLASRQGARWA